MARGKKVDLFVGAKIEDDWQQVKTATIKSLADILKPNEHSLHVKKQNRKGKGVTLVGPFSLEDKTLKELLKKSKQKFACGGKIDGDFIELQGDISEKLKAYFKELGYRFKS